MCRKPRNWIQKDFRESGDIPIRGSDNYTSDEQKEITRLKRELCDAQDELDVLKKHQHSGKMIEAIYLEVSEKTEATKKTGRRVPVSRMLRLLGVSQSGDIMHGVTTCQLIQKNGVNL